MRPDEPRLEEVSGSEPPVEGHAWCPRCDRSTGYTLAKVEFLGNPVTASFFCAECGGRIYPGAVDKETARRKQSEGRWLRAGAAGSLLLMLLLPLILAGAVLYLLWRIL